MKCTLFSFLSLLVATNAAAQFELCNRTAGTIYVAIGKFEVSQSVIKAEARGWFAVETGQTFVAVRSGLEPSMRYHYFAVDDNQNQWAAAEEDGFPFCIKYGSEFHTSALIPPIFAGSVSCPAEYLRVRFVAVPTNTTHHLATIDPSTPTASQMPVVVLPDKVCDWQTSRGR